MPSIFLLTVMLFRLLSRLVAASDYQPQAWLERAFATPLLFPPGDRYSYSNAGFQVLAKSVL